jgi:hypothetical protein
MQSSPKKKYVKPRIERIRFGRMEANRSREFCIFFVVHEISRTPKFRFPHNAYLTSHIHFHYTAS